MVVDDFPAVRKFSEDQREAAMRFVVRALQFPTAERNCGIVAQLRGLKIRKGERSHFRAVRIFRFVAVEHFLPAAGDFVAGNENGLVRPPVTIHERIDVSVVPRGFLGAQDIFDFGNCGVLRLFGENCTGNCDETKNAEPNRSHQRPGVSVGVGVMDAVAIGVDVGSDAGVGVGVEEYVSSSSSSDPDAVATTESDVVAIPTDEVDVVDAEEVELDVEAELEVAVAVGVGWLGCKLFR